MINNVVTKLVTLERYNSTQAMPRFKILSWPYFAAAKAINSIVQLLHCAVYSNSAGSKDPILCNLTLNRVHNIPLCWTGWSRFIFLHPVSPVSFLILFSFLRIGFASCHSLRFQTKIIFEIFISLVNISQWVFKNSEISRHRDSNCFLPRSSQFIFIVHFTVRLSSWWSIIK